MRSRIYIALALLASGVLAVAGVGELLSRPAHRSAGHPSESLQAEAVEIPYGNGQQVSGWRIRGQAGAGAVLLLHGVRSDRRQMMARADFLHRLGHSVLLIDLPAHGESSGDRITFGVREAKGVEAALAFLKHEMPGEPIGVIGVSLGAAAFVLSGPDPRVRAVVLESMYPSIDDAVANRISRVLGPSGGLLAPLLLWQLPLRTGISTAQLRPIDHIGALQTPVFIASGAQDRHTTPAEIRRIFETAAQPRELWIVEGAAHIDLHAFAPQDYESRVGAFLGRYLKPH